MLIEMTPEVVAWIDRRNKAEAILRTMRKEGVWVGTLEQYFNTQRVIEESLPLKTRGNLAKSRRGAEASEAETTK